MSKKLSFIQPLLKYWQTLTAFIVVGVLVLGSGNSKLIPQDLLGIQPASAQRVSPSEVWRSVYQQLPDLPKENQYISKETGQVAENNTLASRLIRYHIYTKGRAPNYRLDWKLTLADYLDANEIMYYESYPGSNTLRQNPIEGDRAVITRLNRRQRDDLVQVLANIFNPRSPNTPDPRPTSDNKPSSNTSITPQAPQPGGAELLK